MIREFYFVARGIVRAPSYAANVVLTLGLGVGAGTIIYSMVAWLLFPRYGFRAEEELVKAEFAQNGNAYNRRLFRSEFESFRSMSDFCSGISGAINKSANVVIDEKPIGLPIVETTNNYFSVLGVSPAIGRGFLENDSNTAEQETVITYRLWETQFASDPKILERDVRVNEQTYRIVGVLPPSYRPPETIFGGLYIPAITAKRVLSQEAFEPIFTFGRLKDGIDISNALVRAKSIKLESPLGAFNIKDGVLIITPINLMPFDPVWERLRRLYWAAMGAVGMLFSIACVNAGNLILTRTLSRVHELAVRLALGCTKWKLLRLTAMESVLLSCSGIMAGVLISHWFLPVVIAFVPLGGEDLIPIVQSVQFSSSTLLIFGCITLGTAIAVSVMPTLLVLLGSLDGFLKEGNYTLGQSRRTRIVQSFLITFEVTLAVVLLVGATMMLQTFSNLRKVDVGYDRNSKLLVDIIFPFDSGIPTQKEKMALYHKIISNITAVPGVVNASIGDGIPRGYVEQKALTIIGRGGEFPIQTGLVYVGPQFLSTLGVPLLAGVGFDKLHYGDPPVAVVNQTAAVSLFHGENPIGTRIPLGMNSQAEVIGVVGNIRSPRGESQPFIYLPYWCDSSYGGAVVLLSTVSSHLPKLDTAIRKAVYQADGRAAVTRVYTPIDIQRDLTTDERFLAAVLNLLAVLALILSSLGVFAVVKYIVGRRESEFGLRIALGARPQEIYILVLREGILAATLGILIGSFLAYSLARLLEAALFEVRLFDVSIYIAIGALLLVAVIVACLAPAARAARADPAKTLRCL